MARSRAVDLVDKSLSQSESQENSLPVVSFGRGMTGVARYLAALPSTTGVSKYIDTMHTLSAVDKYLKKKDRSFPITGVAKYLLRQAVISRATPPMTRVAKYEINLKSETHVSLSSVAKYVAKQELEVSRIKNLTGVAKYQAEKDLITRKNAAASIVERFLEAEAKQAKEKIDVALAAAATAVEQASVEQNPSVLTGVERYAQEQARIAHSKPSASGVAKYLAQRLIEERTRLPQSRVDQYIAQQQRIAKQKPVVSGVSKYVKSHASVPHVSRVVSGVEKYLVKEAENTKSKPLESKVAKYLAKQPMLEDIKNSGTIVINFKPGTTGFSRYLEKHLSVQSLEGEFIPAGQTDAVTGVAKYLINNATVD